MRESGILMHISSLPSPYGIGTLGKEAYAFVDFLAESGMHIWQVLPITPTGYGDSPYQSVSSFAGNPYLIDLDMLAQEGVLDEADLPEDDFDKKRTDYGRLFQERESVLKKAFHRSAGAKKAETEAFVRENAWVEDYAFFSALKKHFQLKSWMEWEDEDIRLRKESSLQSYKALLQEEIAYYVFIQCLFFRQWKALKKYANEKGIRLFGDMPIYVAEDSADVWCNPELFQLDESRRPLRIAGVPPDYFAVDGQRWGNPLYNWDDMKKNGYRWWIERLRKMGETYDIVRVDHFIGFANYYSIDAKEQTARNGVWIDGPAEDFFTKVKKELPGLSIIAEDLGAVNEKVQKLLDFCGYPGMKVLLFGLSGDPKNEHHPLNYKENCIAYTGTHDNSTLLGYYKSLSDAEKSAVKRMLNIEKDADFCPLCIRMAMMSKANTCIIPMQDILGLDDSARMNTPGTIGGINWQWRVEEGSFGKELSQRLLRLNLLSGRKTVS